MHMRSGTYLAKRRAAAGLTVEDVAVRVGTDPKLPLRDRVEWLKRIEADVDPVNAGAASALHAIYPFSIRVLFCLVNAQAGRNTLMVPQICETCGCSELDACVEDGHGCAWAEPGLCTACADAPATAPATVSA